MRPPANATAEQTADLLAAAYALVLTWPPADAAAEPDQPPAAPPDQEPPRGD